MLDQKVDRVIPVNDDPKTLANKFNEYYIDKTDKIRKSIPETYHPNLEEKEFFNGEKLEFFLPASCEEVLKVI